MIQQPLLDELSKQIKTHQDASFTISDCETIGGGSINSSYKLSGNRQSYFVKTNHSRFAGMFAAEAQGLNEIVASHSIRAPQPIAHGEFQNSTYIIMDYLALGGDNKHSVQMLGEHLAAMHAHHQTQHGWHIDNTIGSTPQINTYCESWCHFFRDHRLGYQCELAADNGYPLRQADALLSQLDQLLGHNPSASLLHGDLWSGNYGICQDGTPTIFDPAVYYGDKETDIAMTELFGGFPSRFYEAYWHHTPQEAGYSTRKTLYNLYHIVNHLNLFGGSYYSQAEQMINMLLSEVR